MSDNQPPLEYLLKCSQISLESYELSRLNKAANLRRELLDIAEDWIREEVCVRVAAWLRHFRGDRPIEDIIVELSTTPAESPENTKIFSSFGPLQLPPHLVPEQISGTNLAKRKLPPCAMPSRDQGASCRAGENVVTTECGVAVEHETSNIASTPLQRKTPKPSRKSNGASARSGTFEKAKSPKKLARHHGLPRHPLKLAVDVANALPGGSRPHTFKAVPPAARQISFAFAATPSVTQNSHDSDRRVSNNHRDLFATSNAATAVARGQHAITCEGTPFVSSRRFLARGA